MQQNGFHKHSVKGKKSATEKYTWYNLFYLYKVQKQVNEHPHIHSISIIIHNSQRVEAIQVSTDRRMDKQTNVNTRSGLSSNLKKEQHGTLRALCEVK